MTHSEISRHMEILGVSRGASAETVRAAWRQAARRLHPDVAGPDATEHMARVNAAYEALRDGVPDQVPSQQAVSRGRPFRMPSQRRSLTKSDQKVLRGRAFRRLQMLGLLEEGKTGALRRLFFRKTAAANILVPRSIHAKGAAIVFGFPDGKIRAGDNWLVLPRLRLTEERKITGSGDFSIYRMKAQEPGDAFPPREIPGAGDDLLNGYSGLHAFIAFGRDA